ncbi:FAD-binding oxidoreductase [Nocardioides sp. HDW12B]|uniref:FAD-binding oxidoreductase n=1 Tax=Nocardioides sp. HDW12B TaxID=2714939 RepID=UPI0014076EFC|nr:FAD-binding oxidoreductase [Nocardioides sp. HDW12B]QIK67335.1 FAD-binding oxidoreductase [Nocardioides sp. HDW12B]
MTTETLTPTAREAVASACADVRDGSETDAVDGVTPGLVARPADTAQVAEVMKATAAHGLSVVPRGRGTKLSWGTPPSSADVLLDLSGLDEVLDHAAGDLITVARTGTLVADLQQTVAEGGQRLALDETVPGSSIGGTLAADTSGPRRVAVGTARDLLIGLTIVRADGVVAKSGGRVVKNVAGYDLGKLLIGSFGTLGVMTEAVFRLHPLPETRRWVTARVADATGVHDAVQAVVHSQAVPAAVEVEWPTFGEGLVHVLLEGREDGVAGRSTTIEAVLARGALDVSSREEPPAGGATYPWDTDARGDERATAFKLTFALSGLGDVLTAARESGLHVRGSGGVGVAYAALPAGAGVEAAQAALTRVRETCGRHGGAAVVVDAPAEVKAGLDAWGPIPALDLMRRVKDQFDPDHRLAPGRFVGGI